MIVHFFFGVLMTSPSIDRNGNFGKTFQYHSQKFDRYRKGLKNYSGSFVKIQKKQDPTKFKTISSQEAVLKLLKSYQKLGQYEHLKKSSHRKNMQEALGNTKLKKDFPVRKIVFKIKQFTIELLSSLAAWRGVLKIPEPVLMIQVGTSEAMNLSFQASTPADFPHKVNVYHIENSSFLSNTEKMLQQLEAKEGKLEVIEGKVRCVFAASENIDELIVTTEYRGLQGNTFRLYMEENIVVLKQKLNQHSEKFVSLWDFEQLKRNEITVLLKNNSGFFDENETSKDGGYALSDLRHSQTLRMLSSVSFRALEIELKAIKEGLEITHKVKDYQPEKINEFLFFYHSTNMTYDSETTIKELIQKIKQSKNEGHHGEPGHLLMHSLIEQFLTTEVNKKDREIFEAIRDRIQDQIDLDNDEFAFLKCLALCAGIEKRQIDEKAKSIADKILAKIDKYTEVGELIRGGWYDSPNSGHYISIEAIREGDHYLFHIANAGQGANDIHRPLFEQDSNGMRIAAIDKGIVIKTFKADKATAKEIIKNVLIFAAVTQEKEGAINKFYEIFEHAQICEDYSLPPRGFQKIGNCVVNNQQECFIHICQRLGNTEAANVFMKWLENSIYKEADNYPALKEALKHKESKSNIRPLNRGSSQLILVESKSGKKHVIPQGIAEGQPFKDLTLGCRGDVLADKNPSTCLFNQHALLAFKEGEYYLSRHPKCDLTAELNLIRNALKTSLQYSDESFFGIKLWSGDRIQLNDLELVVA